MKIQIEDLTIKYKFLKREKTILNNVNFKIEEGSLTAITGKSGCGKTTLIESIAGLIKSDGKILIDEININGLKEKERALFRLNNIGYISQFPSLIDELDVEHNITLSIHLNNKVEDHPYINHLMDLLNITDIRKNYPCELSGGQRQRVVLARAMVNKPKLVLADEPTGNLDNINTLGVLEALKKCQREYNQTILLVTHNINVAKQCDRIFMLEDCAIKELIIK